jgi:hypothetical protein
MKAGAGLEAALGLTSSILLLGTGGNRCSKLSLSQMASGVGQRAQLTYPYLE